MSAQPSSAAPATPANRARGWMFLALAIGSEVTGSLSLRGAIDRPWLYVVVAAGFIAALVFLTQVLQLGISIGVAYGVWGACGVALTAIMSMILFNEPITWLMALGIGVIIAGVLCIEMGPHSSVSAEESVA
ncbi:MAG: QacE family quaternary ammonium compound efflux SMR transporter [Aeromicrobium sp.]|nr:MAG: QacE family quaternary ammonium compound efflux SMR transporter [Aeromicrobium sp.]